MSAQRQKPKTSQKTYRKLTQAYKMVVAQRPDMYDLKLDADLPVEEYDGEDSSDMNSDGTEDVIRYAHPGILDPTYESYSKLGGEDSVLDTPILNFERLYTITIHRWPDGNYRCRFEPTKNLRSANKTELIDWIKSVNKLLNLTSDWLEKTQPEFIKEPSPESFTRQGTFTQKSFIKELYQDEQKDTFDLTNFSRIVNNIWLVWDNKCLPFKELFSFNANK